MVTFTLRSFRRAASVILGIAATFGPTFLAHGAPASGGPASPSVSPIMPAAIDQPPPAYPPAYPPAAYAPPAYPPPAYPPPVYNPAPPVAPPYAAGYAPQRLPYEDGQPVPPGYHVEERIRLGQTITGAVLLGAPYLLGLEIAETGHFSEQSGWLAVPVAGPWLMLAFHKTPTCAPDNDTICLSNSLDPSLRVLIVADGILQATGAALMLFGTSGRKLLIRDKLAIIVTPTMLGASGYGPAVSGRF